MKWLGAAVAGLAQHALKGGTQYAQAQQMIQARTDAHQYPGAYGLQRRHEEISAQHQKRQHEQCGFVAAAQYAVIDLHHVQRGGEHHQVQEAAEYGHRHKRRAQLTQRVPQLVRG